MLLGLFFMHGAPASAGAGCHGAPMSAEAAMTATQAAAPAAATASADHYAPSVAAPHHATATAGATCWATPARGKVALSGWAVAVLAVLPLLCAEPASRVPVRFGGGWRGPPSEGRTVLLRVCVART